MDKQLVVKSNFLVEASYRLSAMEQKIILTLSTQIKNNDKEFQKYFFNLGELGAFLGLKTNADYAYLRDVTKNLLTKVLILKKEDSILQTHWLESVEYFEKQGKIALNFNPDLKPFLIQLKNNFTKYQLKFAIQLKSRFSIRVYELLKQYEKIGHRDFLLEDLRALLGVEKDEYPFYGNFKAKVILVAQKELKAKTDISFQFEEIKVGRGVGKIRFYIKSITLEKAELDSAEVVTGFAFSREELDLEQLSALLPQDYREKESVKKLLKLWLKNKNFDYVARNIEYANDGSNAINPGANPAKKSNYRNYLAKALAGDFGLPYKEDKEIKRKAEEDAKQKAKEAAAAQNQQIEQVQNEKENHDRAQIYQKNLPPEALEHLKEEAFSRLNSEHQALVKRKAIGSDILLKIMMDKISLERMSIS